MQWWEETVHALVVMQDWKQQKHLRSYISPDSVGTRRLCVGLTAPAAPELTRET